MEKKHIVPRGMLDAVFKNQIARGVIYSNEAMGRTDDMVSDLQAALRWISENAGGESGLPTNAQAEELWWEARCARPDAGPGEILRNAIWNWNRTRFLASPEATSDQQEIWFIEVQNKHGEWNTYSRARRTLPDAVEHMRRIKLSRELVNWPLRVTHV